MFAGPWGLVFVIVLLQKIENKGPGTEQFARWLLSLNISDEEQISMSELAVPFIRMPMFPELPSFTFLLLLDKNRILSELIHLCSSPALSTDIKTLCSTPQMFVTCTGACPTYDQLTVVNYSKGEGESCRPSEC